MSWDISVIFLLAVISLAKARFSKVFVHRLPLIRHFLSFLKPYSLVSAVIALLKSPSLSKTLCLLRPADTFSPPSKEIACGPDPEKPVHPLLYSIIAHFLLVFFLPL